MKSVPRFALLLVALFLVSGVFFVEAAHASTGTGLEWEAPLKKVTDSITGPVAFAISALMLVAGGAGIAFGGDVSGWLRYVLISSLVIGVLGFVIPLLGSLFGVSAAIIA
jgi:type IV secretion system protein VirB2